MRYLNQMGTLLSGGTTHPTAAVLYHADGEWCGKYMPMQKVAKELSRHQIDFDFVPMDIFTDQERYHTTFDESGLHVNGITYACFIMPYQEYICLLYTSWKQVQKFVKKHINKVSFYLSNI